jgi:uncharacterized NAD-dependent epimerase/dehydratase family protein
MNLPEGNAIVYCEGAFNTTNGKTAHGLVRFTKRYNVNCIIDSKYKGKDALEVIDQINGNIPIVSSLDEAIKYSESIKKHADYFVVGIAPDGGRLSSGTLYNVKLAIENNLNIDCGLHDFLTDNYELVELAKKNNVQIRDIRKTPPREKLHFFTGKIEEVDAVKIAVLGTDSAIGKRTTAWILVNSLNSMGYKTELVGTGQTAWMQGAKYSVIMDSLINDFVSGEIENAVYSAWQNERPRFIVIEGQGSLLNPAYPGGFEIIAAGRPDIIVLQHAPARKEYDGFPGYKIHSLKKQINAIEVISGRKVSAVTINHENMKKNDVKREAKKIKKKYQINAFDVVFFGGEELAKHIIKESELVFDKS